MLESLLSRNEGKILEFKENTQSLGHIIKTVVAFANTAGGSIVIGVKDKTREVVGIKDARKQEERLVSAIADSIVPLLVPDIEVQSFRDKEIIIIHVYHAVGPYYLKSAAQDKGIYIRFGSTNRAADSETIYKLRLLAKNMSYDELPYIQGSKKLLDWSAIKKEFSEVDKTVSDYKSQMLGMLMEQSGKLYPTFGGILLFGHEREAIFPDAIVKCARFDGLQKINFIDQKEMNLHLPLAVKESISFIEKHIKVGAKIGRIRRIDIPQYPAVAIREAVINAFVHADYAMKGSSISIAIFDDRIEITNPGGLPFGMTLEHALAGASRLRNRVIGRVFRELKLIEQWGSGLKRIQDACRQLELKDPEFQELHNQFRVILYSSKELKSKINWEYTLIEYLRKHAQINTNDAAKLWKISTRSARERLKKMTSRGLLNKIATHARDPYAVYILVFQTK